MLLIIAACGNDETQPAPTASVGPATRTPLASPTPTASITPEVIDGVEVLPLRFGEEVELPADIALIIETGCFSCDGPTTGLFRVYRNALGQVRTDALFAVEALGLPPRGVGQDKEIKQPLEPYIHSYALNSDASEIVVSVCTRGECAGIDPASPDAQTTLYRSLDGGVTWSQLADLDGGAGVIAIANDGVVVSGAYSEEEAAPRLTLFPSGGPVQPPPEASEAWPLSLPSGELIWPTGGRLLRSDGSEFLDLGEDVTAVNIWRKNIQLDPSGERLAIVWWTQGPRQTVQDYLGVGTTDGRLSHVFSVPGYAGVGGWVDSNLLLGNASFSPEELGAPDSNFFGYLPALYDLGAGQLHPVMQPFLDPPFGGQRNHIQAVLHGPFARVVNTGACLNVRQEPGAAERRPRLRGGRRSAARHRRDAGDRWRHLAPRRDAGRRRRLGELAVPGAMRNGPQ